MTPDRLASAVGREGGVIESVRAGSLAEQAGVRPGARLLAVNGRPVSDVVDYQFEAAEEQIDLELTHDGIRETISIDKHPDEDAGLEFEDATFDGTRICNNKCFFCFLKGLPKGLRRTVYIKDDDYRLSFLHGNFVTLTNLSEDDWQRLAEQRLSPLNVSVHASELELRRRMLGNDDAPDILAQLRRLGTLGIRAQTQIVLCPGVNDGEHLARTVEDLAQLFPTVQAVSIVPVGASIQYSERMAAVGRDDLESCPPEYCRALVRMVRPWQARLRRDLGVTFAYLSDELYLAAGVHTPASTRYDGFAQYENGVGMTRTLLDDWHRTRRRLRTTPLNLAGLHLTVACGELIGGTLRAVGAEVAEATGAAVSVVPVRNTFFGERIKVSGLLGAGDLIGELRSQPLGDVIFLPRSALDYFGRHFLDDGTPADVERVLGRPVAFATAWSEVLSQMRDWSPSGQAGAVSPNSRTNGKSWAIREPALAEASDGGH